MKKLLLITPDFYNYPQILKSGFANLGYEVTWFSDRPSSSPVKKMLLRLNRRFLFFSTCRYQKKILKKAEEEQYDKVFVILGQAFFPGFFKKLRERIPNAELIYYMWDPLSSFPYARKNFKYFDKVFSFDNADCERSQMFLRPLFFNENYSESEQEGTAYDFVYIATAKPGKIRPFLEIESQMKRGGFLKEFVHIYVQNKLVLHYFSFISKEFRGVPKKIFSFERIEPAQTARLLKSSTIVVDCQKRGQTGLTIRTLEALAAGKKLITTNPFIKKYDFYRPENIYVFDGEIDFEDPFFKEPYITLPKSVLANYSVEAFCKDVLK